MGERGLLILLLAGFCVPAYNQIIKNVFVNTLKSWPEAQAYCREKHTDLATVHSQEEAQQLLNIAGASLSVSAWIGLYRDGTQNWQWSNSDDVIYKSWTEDLFCASINSVGQWEDNVCSEMKAFMCYKETSIITERYTLIEVLKTWTEAQQYCREHHTDLVSIKNASENEEIVRKVQGKPFWIGLFNEPWKWSHQGDNYTFHYWNTGEPNNDGGNDKCVRMIKSGTWGDKDCNFLYPFFCYDGPTPSDPPSTRLSEDATPSDPPSTRLSEDPKTTSPPSTPVSQEAEPSSPPSTPVSQDPTPSDPPSTRLSEDLTPSDPPSTQLSEDKMETLRVQLNAPPGMNLEDPKVSEALLEQIREHFSKNFPMDGVKLRWRKQDGQIFHKEEEEEKKEEKCSEP